MNYGIILAAGNGTRLELKNPIKPLVIIKSKPLFCHALFTFLKNKLIHEIVLVVNKKYHKAYLQHIAKHKLNKPVHIIDGSDVGRHLSLLAAMNFLKDNKRLNGNDIFVTHDAARINVSTELINSSIYVAKKHGYASTVLPLYDSLCEITNKSKYIDRSHKFLVQTPQTFQYKY
jgi:2-C-methyl-D-erythritol 4-phosphate cytidylyltransferase